MNRRAVLDLGTNTFHLLIVEVGESSGDWKTLKTDKIGVRIGAEGGIGSGVISPAAFQRAINAIEEFSELIEEYGVPRHNVRAIGTSAIRNASNAQELVNEVKRRFNLVIEIIDGDREAELIFKGVQAAFDLNKTSLIMDIGGGSVEFIIGNETGLLWKKSFEIGAQRLKDLFMDTDPIKPERIEQMTTWLDVKLFELFTQIKQYRPVQLIGSSGTFDTVYDLYALENAMPPCSNNIHMYEVPLAAFEKNKAEIIAKNRWQRLAMPGMIALRADMIVVAYALIEQILRESGIQELLVSGYALKEGLISEWLKSA